MTETVYSREQIEQWERNLKKLARQPRTSFSKKQAVEALMSQSPEAEKTATKKTVRGRTRSAEKADPKIKNSLLR